MTEVENEGQENKVRKIWFLSGKKYSIIIIKQTLYQIVFVGGCV